MGFRISVLLLIGVSLSIAACSQATFDSEMAAMPVSDDIAWDKTTVTTSQTAPADGITPIEINLRIRNKWGKSLEGKRPHFTVSGSHNVLVPCTVSDQLGASRCRVYSTHPEKKDVFFDGLNIVEIIQFIKIPPTKSSTAIVSSGGRLRLPSGHIFLTSAGVVESPIRLEDAGQIQRARTSIIGTIIR